MMRRRPRVVVFCDLDSLLAAPTLSLPSGRPESLEHLDAEHVALVLCSRRTRAEIDWFARQLRIHGPFVAEHGGAVFVPAGSFGHVAGSRPVAGYDAVEFGRSYSSVVDRLRKTALRLGVPVRGMADMSIEEAARLLDVSLPLARLAKLREYSELCQVRPADRQRLFSALRGVHLHGIDGEPLQYVGGTVDASLGVALLRTLYVRTFDAVVTAGIADAAAQPDLLRLVDYPVAFSMRSPSTLAFPVTAEARARVRGLDAAGIVNTIHQIVAAVQRVGPEISMLLNERLV
jgi:mannosyl-3-phosphoglycerate phosphatase